MRLKSILLFLIFCCSAILPQQAYSQCIDIPDPEVEMIIGTLPYALPFGQTSIPVSDAGDIIPGVPDLNVCGRGRSVMVFFIPSTSNTNQMQCEFTIDLDEIGEDHVTLNNISSANTNDGWSVGGLGTGHATLQFTGSFTNEIYILTLFIGASCDLMPIITGGDMDQTENNQISMSGCYNNGNNGNQEICIETTSESFNLNFSLTSLQEGNTVTTTNLGEDFTMTKQMDVTGDFCLNQFSTYVEFPPNIDFSNLEVKVQMSVSAPAGAPAVGFQATIPAGDVNFNGNIACIRVDDQLGGLQNDYDFCSEHFPGGMGEITMTLCSLRVIECPAGPVVWRTNNCPALGGGSNFNCQLPTQACFPWMESTCYVNVPNGNPDLDVSHQLFSSLDFCGDQAGLVYTVQNNSDETAYGIQFSANNWPWMTIQAAFINGQPVANLTAGVVNNLPPTEDMNFNFNNQMAGGFGLQDINGDGIFSELPPGGSFQIGLIMISGCPFSDECQSGFVPSVTIYRGTVRWNNQCETFSPLLSANSGSSMPLGGPPPVLIVECPGGFDVEDGETYSMQLCVPEWPSQPDFDDPIFGLGDYTNILQVLAYDYEGFELVSVEYDGTTYEGVDIVEVDNGWEVDLGDAELPPNIGEGLACFTLNFEYECPDMSGELPDPINVDIYIYGEWSTCEDCRIVLASLGCGDDEFLLYPSCPCDDTIADCCQSVTLDNFTVLRTNAVPGGNECGVYVCDPVEMVFTGTVGPNYDGIVSACFYNLLFDNGFDFFTNFSVSATLDGNPISMQNQMPFVAGDPLRVYTFLTENITTGASSETIEITVTCEASQQGLENMPIYQYIVDYFWGVLGEEINGDFNKCLESKKSVFFTLFRVDENFQVFNSPTGCNDGININFRAGYLGGSVADEFPGIPNDEIRPIMELDGPFTVNLDMGNTDYEIYQIIWNGNTYNVPTPGNPITIDIGSDIFQGFTPPDKDLFQEFYQLLQIRATGDCTVPNGTNIPVTYDFTYNHNVFAQGTSCYEEGNTRQINTSVNWQNGEIETNPVNPLIVTFTGNSIDGGSAPLELCFNADGQNSEITWVQFTYPTGTLNIQFNGDEGTTCDDDMSGNTTEWFPLGTINQVGDCLQFDYEVLSCEITEIPLNYAIGKSCAIPGMSNDEVLEASVCDPEACLFEGDFTIEIEPSGLIVDLVQCNEADDLCDEITYALVIENPGGGITSDIMLELEFPAQMDFVSAFYEHPYGGIGNPCFGNPGINISGLENGPVALPNLDGVQTANSDADRRILVHVTLRFDECPDENLLDEALRFTVTGSLNCGEDVERTFFQYEDLLADWFFDFDATIDFDPEVELTCVDDQIQGIATLNVVWDPVTGTLPPGQTLVLNVFTSFNVQVQTPINITYGQNPILIPFTFTGNPCDLGAMGARITSEARYRCDDFECSYINNSNFDFINFQASDGTLSIVEVEISDDVCTEPTATVTTTVFTPDIELNGQSINISIFCDDGFGQPTGTPIFTGTHVLDLDPVTGGFGDDILSTVVSSDILDACNGQIVVVLSVDDGCVCIRDIGTAEACCEYCPEVGLLAECLDGNIWQFTIVPDVPNLLVNFSFPGATPSSWTSTTNPTVIEFDVPPTEVCAAIFTDLISNCDEEGPQIIDGGGIQVINERPQSISEEKFKELRLLTACDTLICMPLDECYADGNFTCDQSYNGKFWTLHVEGIYSTNLSPHSVAWTINGQFQPQTGPIADLIFTQPGVYEVCMVINGFFNNGCKKQEACKVKICKTIMITKDPKECWVFPACAYEVKEGQVSFINRTTYNGDKVEYLWDFGDREQSKEVNPIHSYRGEGRYKVTLTATVYNGEEKCENRISVYISIGRGGKGGGGVERIGGLVNSDLTNFQSTVYPNPARESITFEWSAPEAQEGTVEVFNISGQQVYYGTMKADSEGNNSLLIDVDNWAPGMYLLKFQGEQDRAVHRFIVE